MCNSLDKSQTHYAEQKQPDLEDFIICDSVREIFKKVKVAHNDRDRLVVSWEQLLVAPC